MQIKILQSCLGKDGEHLEQGSIVDCDAETGRTLLKFHRAVAVGDDDETPEPTETGDETPATGDDLASYTKAQLLEIAAGYDIANASRMSKSELIAAILEAQQAA
jgi:hypothetical protein